MGITPSNIEYALFFRTASIGDDEEFFHMDLRQRGGRRNDDKEMRFWGVTSEECGI
jgi:hypothetical protein